MTKETLYEKIKTPVLLVDEYRVKKNIATARNKADLHKMLFRPHFKTHQSSRVGEWFREAGISKITVSSVKMAEYFAGLGWQDILIAFPVNIRQINEINELAAKINITLLIDNLQTVDFLNQNLKAKCKIRLKIDAGYGRAGIHFRNQDLVIKTISTVNQSPKLDFSGILTHSGDNYHMTTINDIIDNFNRVRIRMCNLRDRIKDLMAIDVPFSTGDTPGFKLASDFSGIDEIRPGNFVFNDLMQLYAGTCTENEIAVTLACPVCGIYPERKEILILGGAVHFSKEALQTKDKTIFGIPVPFTKDGWGRVNPFNFVKSLSQEHGIIAHDGSLQNIKIGDLIPVLPVHSCLTADLQNYYLSLTGEKINRVKKNNDFEK